MKGLLINVLILGFLLTLYVYVNTDGDKTIIMENSAETSEIPNSAEYKQPHNQDLTYQIQDGDSLYDIGAKYQVPVSRIKEINGLKDDRIVTGEYIDIPNNSNKPAGENTANRDYTNYNDLETEMTLAQTYGDESQPRLEESDVPRNDETRKLNEEHKRKLLQLRQNREKSTREYEDTGNELPTETTRSEPAVVITDGEVINIQSEMDVQDLIQTISEITGENFILDETVKGKKITVIAPSGFKPENAMRLFETVLSLNGFSIVKKNDGTNIIVPKRDIKFYDIETEVGNQYGEPSDRFVTRLVDVKNVKATDIANLLKPLISREGDIVVYPAMNTLIIIERVDNLNRILKIIANLDVETEIEFIKIENAEASEVAAKLVEIFGGITTGTTRPAQRTTQTQQRQRSRTRGRTQATQNQPAVTSQTTGDSSPVGFKAITDERTNSLIIIAYPEDMSKIKAVIEILDVETDQQEEGIYVIRILNADSEQIVSVLSSLFGGGGAFRGSQRSAQRTQRTGTSGASTGLGSVGRGTSGIGGTTQSRQGISRQGVGGVSTSVVVAESDTIRITADPATNSVIVIGSRREYESIKEVIAELDIRRKQVYVEAAILEVGLEKLRSFGTNLSIGFTVNDSALAFGGTILPGVPSLLGVAANPDSSVNLVSSLSGLFLGVIGEEVDPDGSGPIPPIPSFSALFQALTSLTDVNVLSTPSIITTDNEPAEIIVADVIPFPTGSTVGEGGVTVQTIDREPVGIRLSITPQISEGDFLNLNILTEVSALRDTPVQGLNTAQFGIATTTRTADSSVVVKNGQTIVIGGLVQDRESVIQNRVPVLGRIPVLGNLFKFKQRSSQKINLMILLTPRIIENEYDMQRLLEERQKRNMLLQERGFNREEKD